MSHSLQLTCVFPVQKTCRIVHSGFSPRKHYKAGLWPAHLTGQSTTPWALRKTDKRTMVEERKYMRDEWESWTEVVCWYHVSYTNLWRRKTPRPSCPPTPARCSASASGRRCICVRELCGQEEKKLYFECQWTAAVKARLVSHPTPDHLCDMLVKRYK